MCRVSTGEGSPDGPQARRKTCTACRRAKIRCDRDYPSCGRCVRLGIPCIEQLRSQGRPASLSLWSDGGKLDWVDREPSTPTQKRPLCMLSAGDMEEPPHKLQHASLCQPRRQWVIQPLTPRIIHTAANAMVARFGRLFKAGLTSAGKTETTLRCWGRRSLRLGKDASYGALGRIAKVMDVDAGSLAEAPAALSSDADGGVAGGLKGLHPRLRGLDDGSALVACYVEERGRVGMSVNAAFDSAMLSEEEALRQLEVSHCLPLYLWASLFTPEGQALLYESVASLYFGTEDGEIGEVTHVLHCVGRGGQGFPAVVRLRHLVESDSCRSSSILSIIPLPAPSPLSPHPTHAATEPCFPTERSDVVIVPAYSPTLPASIPPTRCIRDFDLLPNVGAPPPLTRTPKVVASCGMVMLVAAPAPPPAVVIRRTPSLAELCSIFGDRCDDLSSMASASDDSCSGDDGCDDDWLACNIEGLDLERFNWERLDLLRGAPHGVVGAL